MAPNMVEAQTKKHLELLKSLAIKYDIIFVAPIIVIQKDGYHKTIVKITAKNTRYYEQQILLPYTHWNEKKFFANKVEPLKDAMTFNIKGFKVMVMAGFELHFDHFWEQVTRKKIDLVFLAEGYTASQMSKFRHDIQRMIKKMAKYEPFKSHMNDFNFWAVESISPDSGCDDPRKNIWKRTLFDAHFNTFNSDRYLTSSSLWTIHEVASVVPYDQIYVLTNTDKYGGGGVFNYFSLTSVDHRSSEEVFVHEFGHAFAGLADEYFYLSEENQDYYPRNVEPWEPNITTLVHFETKWKNLVDSKTPVPTPATKYYQTVVGAFEGAGYCSKGVYRPTQSCLMKELKSPFCPICQKAILNRIRFYTDN
jgi:hypothetical protein